MLRPSRIGYRISFRIRRLCSWPSLRATSTADSKARQEGSSSLQHQLIPFVYALSFT